MSFKARTGQAPYKHEIELCCLCSLLCYAVVVCVDLNIITNSFRWWIHLNDMHGKVNVNLDVSLFIQACTLIQRLSFLTH